MIRCVVFDWNGVIIADRQASFDADNHVLEAFGGQPVSLKTYADTISIPSLDFYVQHGADRKSLVKNPEKWAQVFHEFYEKRVGKVRTRSGLRILLQKLNRKKINCVILSNHTMSGIQSQLQRLKLNLYFSEILANAEKDTTLKRLTKLQRLKKFLKKNRFTLTEVVLIGDSPEEIDMAKATDCISVALTGGYYASRRLKEKHPEYLIHNLNQLLRITTRKIWKRTKSNKPKARS